MGVMEKIEDLVFQAKSLSSIEIVKDKIMLFKMRCSIAYLTETECHLRTSSGTLYKISGNNLQIKEFGDNYVKVEGGSIHNFVIEGGAKDE